MLIVSLRSLRQARKDHRKTVSSAVDGVLIKDDQVLLIKRKNVPFAGQYALPGGFIDPGEKPVEAVVRELEEETSLEVRVVRKIGVYDDPARDPRGRVISTAFLCEPVKGVDKLKEGTDALRAEFLPIEKVIGLNLAFDHEDIFNDALEIYRKTRNK
ncbi:MAG: NUDIX domain-containing protein [Candidatus Heimdallarchaeota archaeon]|nr:NUDIX domain-containing protein [Candidatus Heimdallarchaeota archaeon]